MYANRHNVEVYRVKCVPEFFCYTTQKSFAAEYSPEIFKPITNIGYLDILDTNFRSREEFYITSLEHGGLPEGLQMSVEPHSPFQSNNFNDRFARSFGIIVNKVPVNRVIRVVVSGYRLSIMPDLS